nr:hypothetical protein [Granulosicoccus sp.]
VVSGYVNHELNRWRDNLDRSRYYMATGLAQGNGTFGMVALNTLFLREHNKICEDLARKNPLWRDEQLFQTARMIVTLLEIKIVVEEYINHISAAPDGDDPIKPRQRVFKFDNSFAEQQRWYRTNHIALEFDLLYRWHCFVPKRIRLQNEKETEKEYALSEFINYNDPLINSGLDGVLIAASKQRINAPGLFSTPDELLGAEYAALKMSRDFRLQPYNEYRAAFGLQPMTEFHDLRASKEVTERLKDIYEEDINKLDFLVGLYAERASETRLFGDLMTRMVAYDAFTQVLTNPLVSKNILTKKTITEVGIERLKNTNSLNDIWQRNKDASPKIGDDLQTISMDINGQQA